MIVVLDGVHLFLFHHFGGCSVPVSPHKGGVPKWRGKGGGADLEGAFMNNPDDIVSLLINNLDGILFSFMLVHP